MLPAIVPVSRFLIRTQHLVIAVSHLEVYESGCMLQMRISGRAGGDGPQIHSLDAFERLVFAARFGRDITAVLAGRYHVARNEGPLQLSDAGSETGESGSRGDSIRSLWLEPLPPPVQGTLSITAPDLGPELAPCPLDGQAIVSAAEESRPYWR